LVITSKRGWFNLDLRGVWDYRDLILLLVHRDIISQYKQTVLGPIYFMLTPIVGTMINTLIFGKIAKLSTDGIPQFLFYMSGNLFWSYFSTCLGAGKSVFQSNVNLFSQVYFPRLCIPISQNISALFKLSMQCIVFIGIYIYFIKLGSNMIPSFGIILLPILMLQCSLLGLGTGILMSSFTVRYRDLNFIYNFITQFWMYISPVVYPMSVIPDKWRYIMSFNPMVGIIETARQLIFGTSSLEYIYIINGLITTSFLVIIGLLIFNRVEKTFVDTI